VQHVKIKAGTASPLFRARDPERVRSALRALDGGARIAALAVALNEALDGSDSAAREYVRGYVELTERLLEEAHDVRPDIVVSVDDRLFVAQVKRAPARAPVDALLGASAESPFGPWTAQYEPVDAVVLDLTSRVRQLIGLRGLEPPAPENGYRAPVGDLEAQRFIQRVRHHLNHPGNEDPLKRLMQAFDLSKTELAALFGVRRQAVDQWLERGVPGDRQEKLGTLLAIADLLERKLKPGRLPGVARRPADAYDGKTMLELIAADGHRGLLDQVRASFDWASAA
jgi:transcriptional regulator with XRE-family HTH domain